MPSEHPNDLAARVKGEITPAEYVRRLDARIQRARHEREAVKRGGTQCECLGCRRGRALDGGDAC